MAHNINTTHYYGIIWISIELFFTYDHKMLVQHSTTTFCTAAHRMTLTEVSLIHKDQLLQFYQKLHYLYQSSTTTTISGYVKRALIFKEWHCLYIV